MFSRETMLIVWQRALSGKNSFDGSIDIREIKEVRRGKNSRDFDKWGEETGRESMLPENQKKIGVFGRKYMKNLRNFAIKVSPDKKS